MTCRGWGEKGRTLIWEAWWLVKPLTEKGTDEGERTFKEYQFSFGLSKLKLLVTYPRSGVKQELEELGEIWLKLSMWGLSAHR